MARQHETPFRLRKFNKVAAEITMAFAAAHVKTTQLIRDGLR
jgi:hypothetical protein